MLQQRQRSHSFFYPPQFLDMIYFVCSPSLVGIKFQETQLKSSQYSIAQRQSIFNRITKVIGSKSCWTMNFFSCFFQTGQAIWLNQCWHNPIPCSMKQLGALLLPLDEILVSNSLHAQVPPPTLPHLCPNSSPVAHSHSLQGVNGILWREVVLPLDKWHWCQHRWFCLVLQHLITNLSRTTL